MTGTYPSWRSSRTRRGLNVAAACLVATVWGCASMGGSRPPGRTFDHLAAYQVSCSVSDECRVQYLDEEGVLKAREIVGEWNLELGVDVGTRIWIRAWGGGCPPRPLRITILLDGTTVAETLERADHRSRCDWLQAETEFVVP